MNQSDDDDVPQLSADTLAILQDFYREQKEKLDILSSTKNLKDENAKIDFQEDWQLSQFWYSDETVNTLVNGALNCTSTKDKIALISCPSLYQSLRNKTFGSREIKLFEYDKRFSVFYDDFIFFDYKSPLAIPRGLRGNFELVICDPPFLSEDCLTKISVTVKFLAKRNIVLCTGAVMNELAEKLLKVKKCNFSPQHKNNLANEFWCYSNFNFDEYL